MKRSVHVMESTTSSIIPAITSSATTAHMVFLSSSNLVSLYLLNTEYASALSRSPKICRQISGSLATKKSIDLNGIWECQRNTCRWSRFVLRTAYSLPLSAMLPWIGRCETSGILLVDHLWKLGDSDGCCFYCAHWPAICWNIWAVHCFPITIFFILFMCLL